MIYSRGFHIYTITAKSLFPEILKIKAILKEEQIYDYNNEIFILLMLF